MGVTPQMKELLDFLRHYRRERGRWPTYRLTAKRLGLSSVGAVIRLMEQLEDRGRLKRTVYPHARRADPQKLVIFDEPLSADQIAEQFEVIAAAAERPTFPLRHGIKLSNLRIPSPLTRTRAGVSLGGGVVPASPSVEGAIRARRAP